MVLSRRAAVRDIEAAPAIHHPRLRPGVAGDLRLGEARLVDVAAHVARGYAQVAAARDEDVRVVLAHAVLRLERLRRRGVRARHAGLERELPEYRHGEIAQPRERAGPA